MVFHDRMCRDEGALAIRETSCPVEMKLHVWFGRSKIVDERSDAETFCIANRVLSSLHPDLRSDRSVDQVLVIILRANVTPDAESNLLASGLRLGMAQDLIDVQERDHSAQVAFG